MYLKFYTEGGHWNNNCIAVFCSKGGRVAWGDREKAPGIMATSGASNSYHIGHEDVNRKYLFNRCWRVDASYVQSYHPALLEFIDRTYRVIGWDDDFKILEVFNDDL